MSSFTKLKKLLTTAPVLFYPVYGPQCELTLETDASKVGLGSVLAQKQVDVSIHPITYASSMTDTRETMTF